MSEQKDREKFEQEAFETHAGKPKAQIDAEYAALLAEEKALDVELKREAVAKLREQIQTKKDANAKAQAALLAFVRQREAMQAICNHRKGGRDADAIIRGQGTSAMYCVIKHKLPWGGYWVICSRCGKEWHPANPFAVVNGKLSPQPATKGWEEAVNWPSDNTPSASSYFEFKRDFEVTR